MRQWTFHRVRARKRASSGRFVKEDFWWEEFLRINEWSSAFTTVSRTLLYLKERKVGSEGSRRSYGYYLSRFCQEAGTSNPDELVQRKPEQISRLVNEFLESKPAWTNHYRNTVASYLGMHFKVNGFLGPNALRLRTYYTPPRFRANPEHVPTIKEVWKLASNGNAYTRALVFFLYFTGLRVSTACALKYSDIKREFEKRVDPMFVPIFPEMKLRVPGACKGNVPYYTFITGRGLDSLRAHIGSMKDYLGPLFTGETFLFPPASNASKVESATRPLNRVAMFRSMKYLAKKSGMDRWQDFAPHCLRKAYERILRSQTTDGGLLDVKTQEFLMGHILPSPQDRYFASGVYVSQKVHWNHTLVDELRWSYSRLDFEGVVSGGGRGEKVGKTEGLLQQIQSKERELESLRQELAHRRLHKLPIPL